MLHAELFLFSEVCSICALTCHWVKRGGRGGGGVGCIVGGVGEKHSRYCQNTHSPCGVPIANTHLCIGRLGLVFRVTCLDGLSTVTIFRPEPLHQGSPKKSSGNVSL